MMTKVVVIIALMALYSFFLLYIFNKICLKIFKDTAENLIIELLNDWINKIGKTDDE